VRRVVRLTRRYLRNAERLDVVVGSERGRAVAQTIAALADAVALPGPGDSRVVVPPTHSAFVRRVRGRNLWVWYRATDAEVAILALTPDPPVPVDDDA
jgi:hypothetical protein